MTATVSPARRGDFLRQLAHLIGDRDDAGDGDVHRAALAARQVVLPKAKAISGLAEWGQSPSRLRCAAPARRLNPPSGRC